MAGNSISNCTETLSIVKSRRSPEQKRLNLKIFRSFTTAVVTLGILNVFSCFQSAEAQIIIIPRNEVQEPFKNNPKWEDFKTAQFDRIKVLGTLVANVWTFLDSIDNATPEFPLTSTFVKYHVRAFAEFFKQSEARLAESNPYAIIDPAIGIHTLETLYRLSNMPSVVTLDALRVKWMEIDKMALSVHVYFNETTQKMLANEAFAAEEILKIPEIVMPVWKFSKEQNGTYENITIDAITAYIDQAIDADGNQNHLIRGLVKLLTKMIQVNVDYRPELNYYCYGNNEFGVFEDIYDVLTDAALYLCMMDMKTLILNVYHLAYSKFVEPGKVQDNLEERKKMFADMVERIKRKIDFAYFEGSDYSELPHPPIFKCDKTPEEPGNIPSQWGRNVTTGMSPEAGATHPYDPQAGPEKGDGMVGYLDIRRPVLEYAQFDKAFHGYLESELVLNPESLCRGTCRDYKRPTKLSCDGKDCKSLRSTHCEPDDPDCMKYNQCPEYALNCIRSSYTVEMCVSPKPDRYYNHFNYPPGASMGRANDSELSACQSENHRAKERWEMEFNVILETPQRCELCLCTCMSPQDQDLQHYVDLQPVLSDVSSGFVVSAVRFVQEERVLRLAIEQGKPLKLGDIDLESTKWVELPQTDKKDPAKTVPIGMHGFMRMNFDVVVGEAHQVVTGVRFKLTQNDLALSLEVQVTPISWPASDPSKISLKGDESLWIQTQEYPHLPKKPLSFYKPNTPTVQEGPSMPDVVYNSYVEFTVTDYDVDLAQTTIPFFDTQPVHHYDTKRWLQGVGLMHKGKPGSGGFISPIIVPSKGKKSAE